VTTPKQYQNPAGAQAPKNESCPSRTDILRLTARPIFHTGLFRGGKPSQKPTKRRNPMKKLMTVLSVLAITALVALPARAEKKEKVKSQDFTGVVTAVDVAKNTVSVQKKDETKTFTCNDSTKVFLAKKQEGKLADIKQGEKVNVKYTMQGETAVCLKLAIAEKKAKKEAAKTE
jgi:hypothetical protein